MYEHLQLRDGSAVIEPKPQRQRIDVMASCDEANSFSEGKHKREERYDPELSRPSEAVEQDQIVQTLQQSSVRTPSPGKKPTDLVSFLSPDREQATNESPHSNSMEDLVEAMSITEQDIGSQDTILGQREAEFSPVSASLEYPGQNHDLAGATYVEELGYPGKKEINGTTANAVDGDRAVAHFGTKEEFDQAFANEGHDAPHGGLAHAESFPFIPPIQQSQTSSIHPLSHSQVGEIIEEDEHELDTDLRHAGDATRSGMAEPSGVRDPFSSFVDGDDPDFFARVDGQAVASSGNTADEARYDEGIPLMSATHHHHQASKLDSPQYRSGSVITQDAKEDYNVSEQAASGEEIDKSPINPHTLNRKSTAQVMNSMHYAPHNANHTESEPKPEPEPEPEQGDERPSLANLTGGGIAVCTSTVLSQVLSEPNDSSPKNDDLAEMWKAALGDEDLLEDNDSSVDPSGFFGDDDEGFLEDNDNQAMGTMQQTPSSPPVLQPVYGPDGSMRGFVDGSVRQSTSIRNQSAAKTQDQRESSPYHGAQQQPYASLARPPMPQPTQSFADKSKGGYTSPYDIPMDVTRPKKRTAYQSVHPSSDEQVKSSRPPPPRSSSMLTESAQQAPSQPPLPKDSKAYAPGEAQSQKPFLQKSSSNAGGFFEELPSSKPRPSSSAGRALPALPAPSGSSPPLASQIQPPRQHTYTSQSASGGQSISQQYSLLPPERLSLFGNGLSSQGPVQSGQTVPNARYSPAPPTSAQALPQSIRYAASPAVGVRPLPAQSSPFQPRTSSPLAQNHPMPLQSQQGPVSNMTIGLPQSSGMKSPRLQGAAPPGYLALVQRGPDNSLPLTYPRQPPEESTGQFQPRQSPPAFGVSRTGPLSQTPSDSSNLIYTPEPEHSLSDGPSSIQQPTDLSSGALDSVSRAPPQRAQTQSPGAGRYRPEVPMGSHLPYQRPASVNHQVTTPVSEPGVLAGSPVRSRARAFSRTLNYIKPSDGRELDPLERWRGCPIISFGSGGTIVSSFPKQVPRYAVGQNTPMIKCSPGEVTIQNGRILALDHFVVSFPGPLKAKSRKKEVLDWLQQYILRFEAAPNGPYNFGMLPDPERRREEKILLWKVVKILVEHDGLIEGNKSAERAVRSVLSPQSYPEDSALHPQSFNAPLLGISRRSGSHSIPDAASTEALEQLRQYLLQGEREKAVWHAVDNRLWAHALLLASTLDQNIWRQVSQEFVRQEIKTFGENTESLAALYQVFAGNWEDSVDELVPPSARAGLQMMSKSANTGPAKNALDGLDRWRETLTLILSNRTNDDGRALSSLGQLLAGYGRTEASHICYIFAKAPALFGGPDDPQVSIALLGADHLQQPYDYGRDVDSILLTEVYDFARTVLASSSQATSSPHLQSYKLYHAMILAEYGYRTEAQQYCDVIAGALNSTTKRSPYYHNLLLGALENLMDRLRQTPRDSSGSWISKPSIDKVSGSLWAKFNSYVAGDESDAASTGSGRNYDAQGGSADTGPFARMAEDTPNLSRSPSTSDLYGSYNPVLGMHQSVLPANTTNSRQALAGIYTPRSSLEQQGRLSQEHQRPSHNDSLRPLMAQQQYQSRPTSSSSYNDKPASSPSNYPARTVGYLPTPPSQTEYLDVAPRDSSSSSLYQQQPYQATMPSEPRLYQERLPPQLDRQQSNSYTPLSMMEDSHSSPANPQSYGSPAALVAPSTSTYEPPSYEPQTETSREPASYDPEAPHSIGSPVEEKPKKKSFTYDDDEDDFEAQAAALRKEEKAHKDREVDEAFRQAAEADGKSPDTPHSIQSLISNSPHSSERQSPKTQL